MNGRGYGQFAADVTFQGTPNNAPRIGVENNGQVGEGRQHDCRTDKHAIVSAKWRCAMKAITKIPFQWPIPLEKYDRSNKVTKEELAHLQVLVRQPCRAEYRKSKWSKPLSRILLPLRNAEMPCMASAN